MIVPTEAVLVLFTLRGPTTIRGSRQRGDSLPFLRASRLVLLRRGLLFFLRSCLVATVFLSLSTSSDGEGVVVSGALFLFCFCSSSSSTISSHCSQVTSSSATALNDWSKLTGARRFLRGLTSGDSCTNMSVSSTPWLTGVINLFANGEHVWCMALLSPGRLYLLPAVNDPFFSPLLSAHIRRLFPPCFLGAAGILPCCLTIVSKVFSPTSHMFH